jgi:hypothetical protein
MALRLNKDAASWISILILDACKCIPARTALRPEATQGICVLPEAKGMKKVCIPIFDVMLCCKRRNPPHIVACREGFSERMGNGCIESLGQLVDIGLNLPLAPSVSTPVLVNSLSSRQSHAFTRLQLIVKDG